MELTMEPSPTGESLLVRPFWEPMWTCSRRKGHLISWIFINVVFFRTDFLFAQAMGYSGRQEADDAGEVIGGLQVYSYLGGRVKHFKHIGGTHGNTLGNAQIKEEVKKVIIGAA